MQTYVEAMFIVFVCCWFGSNSYNSVTKLSCAIYTHTPARKSSTNFQQYYFVIQICSTNWLGHGDGYKWHSSKTSSCLRALCFRLHVIAYCDWPLRNE